MDNIIDDLKIEKTVNDIENDIFIRKHRNLIIKAKSDRNKIIHAAYIEANLIIDSKLNFIDIPIEAKESIEPYAIYAGINIHVY